MPLTVPSPNLEFRQCPGGQTSESYDSLITRGDDAGLCISSNLAMMDACRHGIVRNVSILAVGPAAAHAVQVLQNQPGIALGLHAALTCEWADVPWRAISDPARVPTLVDSKGRFPVSIEHVPTRADANEVECEVQAQLEYLRNLGASVKYIDDHMAFAWHARIKEVMLRVAAREGLVFGDTVSNPLPELASPPSDPVENLCRRIETSPRGCHLLILHPAFDAPDMREFRLPGEKKGASTACRVREHMLSKHPDVLAAIRRRKIRLLRYDQANPICRNTKAGVS